MVLLRIFPGSADVLKCKGLVGRIGYGVERIHRGILKCGVSDPITAGLTMTLLSYV